MAMQKQIKYSKRTRRRHKKKRTWHKQTHNLIYYSSFFSMNIKRNFLFMEKWFLLVSWAKRSFHMERHIGNRFFPILHFHSPLHSIKPKTSAKPTHTMMYWAHINWYKLISDMPNENSVVFVLVKKIFDMQKRTVIVNSPK